MANVAISELPSYSNELKDEDLILVSNNNGNGSFTSMKMKGSVLKSGTSSNCQAATALTSYGAAKTTDVNNAKTAITTSISGLNNISVSQVQNACQTAIDQKNVSTLTTQNINDTVTQVITSNNDVIEQLNNSSTKSLMCDYSQIIERSDVSNINRLSSDSIPFDCFIYYSIEGENFTSTDNPILFDDVDRRKFLTKTSGGYYQTCVEQGTKIKYERMYSSSHNCEYIAIIPLLYGRTSSVFNTYSLYDFMTDSDKYSELQTYFSSIEVRGGDKKDKTDFTLIDTKAKADLLTLTYYCLRCTTNTMISIIGRGTASSITPNNYFSKCKIGKYDTNIKFPLISTDTTLTKTIMNSQINFNIAFQHPRLLKTPISFFNNIQIAKIEGLTFG